VARYDFHVAGVTMGNRQKTLRKLCNAVRLVCKEPDAVDEYDMALSKINVRLKRDRDNAHDAYAVLVQVWSKKKEKWLGLGYVPRKIQIPKNNKKTALCVVVAKMLSRKMIKGVRILDLGHFIRNHDDEEKIIYYCKVEIEFNVE